MKSELREKLLPLTLCAVVIITDQITKLLIVAHIPPMTIGASFFGDFFRIIHVTNTGVAFSMGGSLPQTLRGLLFAIAPLAVLIVILVLYFKSNEFTVLQRWAIAGVAGGGFGNLIDRFFRPEGVVDFLDFKFYGLFGLDRWPTFNVADMSVVICGILLVASFFANENKEK